MNSYRILILDDDSHDAELVQLELNRAAIPHTCQHVQSKNEFIQALDSFNPDLILSDCRMPGFDGLSALAIARNRNPEIPYIFVSGTMGEELAIETLKKGATDYVLKDRMTRFIPAVKRALEDWDER